MMYIILSVITPLRLSFLIWSYKKLKFLHKAFKTTDSYKVNQLKGFLVSIFHSVFKNSLQEILCLGVKAEIFTGSHCTKGSGEEKKGNFWPYKFSDELNEGERRELLSCLF